MVSIIEFFNSKISKLVYSHLKCGISSSIMVVDGLKVLSKDIKSLFNFTLRGIRSAKLNKELLESHVGIGLIRGNSYSRHSCTAEKNSLHDFGNYLYITN